MRVANLLVGNDEGSAGLEITLGGLQLRFEDERIVAWCGGEFDVQIGSRALPTGHVAHLQAGDELKFGRAQIGCRCWLAISGGIDVPAVLGSRSTDLRASFGGFEGRGLRDGGTFFLYSIWLGLFTDPGYRYFVVDRTARLGESGEAGIRFCVSFVAWIGPASTLQPFNVLRANHSAFHRIRIAWVSALMVRN